MVKEKQRITSAARTLINWVIIWSMKNHGIFFLYQQTTIRRRGYIATPSFQLMDGAGPTGPPHRMSRLALMGVWT